MQRVRIRGKNIVDKDASVFYDRRRKAKNG